MYNLVYIITYSNENIITTLQNPKNQVFKATTFINTSTKGERKHKYSKLKCSAEKNQHHIINYDRIFNYGLNNNVGLQTQALFIKRKFGLFKTTDFEEKRLKQQLIHISNYIKYNSCKNKESGFKKKIKTIFARKLNKLFFRAGRTLITQRLNFKKYLIQKYISKKITHTIKKPWTHILYMNTLSHILVKCGMFYTQIDTSKFIGSFGVKINEKIIYNKNQRLNASDVFVLPFSKYLFIFLRSKRHNVYANLKKIKFYKFRSKFFVVPNKSIWLPTKEWLNEHSFLYTQKYTNVEFDLRSLSGVYLYDLDFLNFTNFSTNMQISLYMSRSYNWKYLV